MILDTGPNLSHLTLGALAAAHHIIIPVSATVWSTTGLRKFIRWVDANRDDEVIDAQLLGLLATMVIARTRIGRDVVGEMRQSLFPYFETTIPKRVGAEDAVMDRAVAGESGVDQKFSKAYLTFAEEVMARVAATTRKGSSPCLSPAAAFPVCLPRHQLRCPMTMTSQHSPHHTLAPNPSLPRPSRQPRSGRSTAFQRNEPSS